MGITSLFDDSGLNGTRTNDAQLHSSVNFTKKKRLYTPHKIIKSPFCFIVYVNWNVENE